MEGRAQVSATILNRNYPPAKGITGDSAAHLAAALEQSGIVVNIVTVANAQYGGGANTGTVVGKVHGVKTFYNGKNKLFRLLASLLEGYMMARKAAQVKSDWNIVMTDPPLLNLFSALRFRKKHPWILWSMDLYPEAFSSAKLIKHGGLLFNYVRRKLIQNPPAAVIALGPVQEAFIRQHYYPAARYINLPCGVFQRTAAATSVPEWRKNDGKIYLGYCGNIGEAHSVAFLKSVISNIDPSRFVLLLSLYGARAAELTAFAAEKPGVVFVPSVSRNALSYIDIHLATLKDEWVNVCVPSKTVSSVCAGATFLYCGIEESDNWVLLNGSGWRVEEGSEMDTVIQDFFAKANGQLLEERKNLAKKRADELWEEQQEAYRQIIQQIKR